METQNIPIEHVNYPKELKKIKQPPQELYVVGNLQLLQNPKIAIIGSRNCTTYGKKMALNFAKKLSERGYTIVSGMAKGIDYYAHMGGVLGKGKTIAVLPCGLGTIDSSDGQTLYQEIIQQGGLVVSEYTEEIGEEKEHFIARNRIVAGMVKGVLVIEGDYRSGTTITARLAKQNAIPVFCIPGNLDSGKSYTPNVLIKQGNFLVTSEQDIIDRIQNQKQEVKQREPKIQFEEDIERQYKQCVKKEEEKEKPQYAIYQYMTQEAVDIETLHHRSNMAIDEINYEVTMLTIEGYIQELPGKQYRRI